MTESATAVATETPAEVATTTEKVVKANAAKPKTEKTKAVRKAKATSKASSNGKVSKKDVKSERLTYSQIMSTALPDGSLRKPFLHVLTGLAKAQYPLPFAKVVKASKIVARGVAPSLKFLAGEGMVKVAVSEDEGNLYSITASGRKALEKAAK